MIKINIFKPFLDGEYYLGFELIYRVCRGPLIRFAMFHLHNEHAANDAVAEAFRLLWQKKGDFQNELHIKRFLRRTVMNKCLTERRTQLKSFTIRTETMKMRDLAALELKLQAGLDAYSQLAVKEILVQMERLDEKQRLDFYAHIFESQSYQEIAEARGVTQSTVRTNVSLAKTFLQNFLEVNGYRGYSKNS